MTSYTFNYLFRDLIRALKFQITEVLKTRNSNQAARPSQRGGGTTVWHETTLDGLFHESIIPMIHRLILEFWFLYAHNHITTAEYNLIICELNYNSSTMYPQNRNIGTLYHEHLGVEL